MGAEYLFYMKSIETHARAILTLIILGIGTVHSNEIRIRPELPVRFLGSQNHKLGFICLRLNWLINDSMLLLL